MIEGYIVWALAGVCLILICLMAFMYLYYIRPLKAVGGMVLLKCLRKKVPLFILDTGKFYVFKAPDNFIKGTGLSEEGEYEGFCPPHSLKPNQFGLMVGFGDAERGIMLPSEVIKFIDLLKQRNYTKERINQELDLILEKDYTQEQFNDIYFKGKDKGIYVKSLIKHLKHKVEPNLIDVGVVKEFFRWGVSKTLQTLKLRDTAEKVAFLKYDTKQNMQKWVPMLFGLGSFAIILVMAYIMFSQYTNYSDYVNLVAQLKGQLAVCQAQIGVVNPTVITG